VFFTFESPFFSFLFSDPALSYSDSHIAFAMDGVVVVNSSSVLPAPDIELWPIPFYLIVNTAVRQRGEITALSLPTDKSMPSPCTELPINLLPVRCRLMGSALPLRHHNHHHCAISCAAFVLDTGSFGPC
jgi:hypothetical protein